MNYFRFNLRSDFLSALRFKRAALVDGESKIQRSNGINIRTAIKPPKPLKNNELSIPPSIAQSYL